MLNRFSMRQMRVFAEVAKQLNYSAVARTLHLTQPAVSLHMKQLEQATGLALVEQVGRRLYLTEAGRELAAATEQLLDVLRDTGERIEALRGVKAGMLNIAAVSTANYFVPALLAAFTARFPGARVKLAIGNRDEVISHLAANDIDIAIMGRPPRRLATTAEPFARHPLGVVVATTHPLAGKRRIPLSRLAGERFIIRETGSGTRAAMEHVFRDRGVQFRAEMEFGSNETIKQAVIAGMGVSFISLYTAGLELETGRLAALDVAGLPTIRDWYAIHLRQKRLSPICAEFRSFLLEEGAGLIERTTGISPAGRIVGAAPAALAALAA